MGELGYKLKALVIGLAMVSCIIPVPAYASTVEDWATLNGWLSSINGNIQLCYAELTNISSSLSKLNSSNWTNTRVVDLLGKMAYIVDYTQSTADYLDGISSSVSNIEVSTGENGNLDISLDGIVEATSGTYLLIDSLFDHVENIENKVTNLDTNLITHTSNFKTFYDWFTPQLDYLIDYVEGNNAYLSTIKGILDNNTSSNKGIKQLVKFISDSVDYLVETVDVIPGKLTSIQTSVNNAKTSVDSLLTAWNAWKNAGYTVDTGLTIPAHPSLTAITNAVNSCKSDLDSILAAWNAWKNAGYTVDTGLTIPAHPSLTAITNAVNSCKSDLNSILADWNAWKNAGYKVATGLTVPSLSTIESRLQNLINRWDAWSDAGYKVDTGLSIPGIQNLETGLDGVNTKLQSVLDFLHYWDDLGFPVDTGLKIPEQSKFDDTHILLGISSLGESVDAIYKWLLVSATADQVIGDFDFGELADNANAVMENASTLAPFVGFELIAVMLSIWASVGVHQPNLDMQFNFVPGTDGIVNIDLSWLADAQPLFNMLCISMLILCLVNSSIRIIEQEATA